MGLMGLMGLMGIMGIMGLMGILNFEFLIIHYLVYFYQFLFESVYGQCGVCHG